MTKGRSRHAEGRRTSSVRLWWSVFASGVILLLLVAASAHGDDQPSGPTYSGYLSAIEKAPQGMQGQLTDEQAASELPHHDLGRSEALELLSAVFGRQLAEPAGPFDELEVHRFLSDNVAVVSTPGKEGEGQGRALLDSTMPLRPNDVTGDSGEAVDLTLENTGGELQSANPLVNISIPTELGEGVAFPGSGIRITPENVATDRGPSTIEQSVAFYPNVAPETDLAWAMTPGGVESLTQLRSPEAPRSQSFQFELPPGASLSAVENGGAIVANANGEQLLSISPPSAIDATGRSVPSSLEVAGSDSITLSVSPPPDAQYPILLDPVMNEYFWGPGATIAGLSDWKTTSTNASTYPATTWANCGNNCYSGLPWGWPGLYIGALAGGATFPGAETEWSYYVPRWQEDWNKYNSAPTSYIYHMYMYSVGYWHRADSNLSPYLVMGIWQPVTTGWAVHETWSPAQYDLNETTGFEFAAASPQGKEAVFALVSTDSHSLTSFRDAYLGYAQIYLTDEGPPTGTVTAPSAWVNAQASSPIGFSFEDSGLGLYSAVITDSQNPSHSWTTSMNCTGVASNPCPRKWTSSTSGQPKLAYDPSVLPQGVDTVNVKTSDPLGYSSTTTTQIKVDHTEPTISLSGSMTEQAALGTTRPQYLLKVESADGTEKAPQSGIASTEITVDGKKVDSTAAGCASKNCAVTREWLLKASEYAVGKHVVVVKATDAVGLVAEKTLTVEIQPDTTAPQLNLSGSLKSAPGGWINQPNTYSVTAIASDAGSGVTQLAFKIDGVQVGSASQSCANGGCTLNKTFSMNSASYSGGPHTALITASDGVGKSESTSWTFKVNTVGSTTASQVAATSNALVSGSGESSPASTVGSFPYEPSLGAETENADRGITGSGAHGDISLKASNGYSLSGLSGLPFVMAPSGAVSESAASQPIAGGDGVAYPSIRTNTDLLTRPVRNGIANYLVFHTAEAVQSFGWSISGPRPISLSKREDGGVNITITPETEVPLVEGGTETSSLSEAPQVVASIAAPKVLDGKGLPVPASLNVYGTEVVLTLSPGKEAVYPLSSEVSLHILGPLLGWFPEPEDSTMPSTVPANALEVGPNGEPNPTGTSWSSNAEGTEVTVLMPDNAGVEAITQTVKPAPGTSIGVTVINPPTGEYAPNNEASASCIAGFCAGGVVCSAVGPNRPYSQGGPIQTYALIACSVHGDLPKDFEYVRGGACLQRRYAWSGHVVWASEKCNDGISNNPNWNATRFVTDACPSGVWRGEAWAGVALSSAVSETASYTAATTTC